MTREEIEALGAEDPDLIAGLKYADYVNIESLAIKAICEQLFTEQARRVAIRKLVHSERTGALPVLEMVKWLLLGKLSDDQREAVRQQLERDLTEQQRAIAKDR